ncbi:MAG: prepilin peptidase [Proteobacteria bacterium]|nr:prepilin peptidase [Pseudomonadota bacterium]
MIDLLRSVDSVWLFVFAFIGGACVGSFLNVCIYRIPRGESIVFPPSRCPSCGQRIRFFDNIPILSYLLLRGRCRNCGSPISLQYPLVEFLSAIISLLLLKQFGPTVEYVGYFIFAAALIVVSAIDFVHRIVPDRISLPGIVAGLAFSFGTARMTVLDSAIGILAGGGSLLAVTLGYAGFVRLRERFRGTTHQAETEKALKGLSLEELKKEAALYAIDTDDHPNRKELMKAIGEAQKEGMGGGDIKLLAMIGAFLGGWKPILFVILVASFLGCVVGVPLMVMKGRDSKYAIPFGPFLGAGAIVYLLWGVEIMGWYLTVGK